MYTAGYLAFKEDACMTILKFMTAQLLPSILTLPSVAPGIPSGDPRGKTAEELRQYCETLACDALKMLMGSAGLVNVHVPDDFSSPGFWPRYTTGMSRLVDQNCSRGATIWASSGWVQDMSREGWLKPIQPSVNNCSASSWLFLFLTPFSASPLPATLAPYHRSIPTPPATVLQG